MMIFEIPHGPHCHDERARQKNIKSSSVSTQLLLYLILFILIALKLYKGYSSGLSLFVWLYLAAYYMNTKVIEAYENPNARTWCFLANFIGVLYIIFLHYTLSDGGLYRTFLLQPPVNPVLSFTTAFCNILVLDCTVRFLSSFVKCTALLASPKLINLYDMGSILFLIETCSIFIRQIPPGVIWICFMAEVNWPETGSLFGRIFFTVLYSIFKAFALFFPLRRIWKALLLLKSPKPYIIQNNPQSGERCPVCQETYSVTAVLSCNDKLCSGCAERWCNESNKCPLCDNKYREGSYWRQGSMSWSIQFY